MRSYHLTQPVDLNLALRSAGDAAREPRRREPYVPPMGGYDDDEDEDDETRLRLTEEAKFLLKVLLCFAALGFAFGAAFAIGGAVVNLALAASMGMPIIP